MKENRQITNDSICLSFHLFFILCTLGGVPLGRGGPAGVVVAVVVVVFVVVVVGAFVVVSFGVVGAAVVGGPSPSTVPAVQSWTN
jgi:hypothetical protein